MSVGIMASAVVVSTGTFPTLADASTETGTALGTNNAVALPATVAAGDLIVVFGSHDTSTNISAAAGYTQVAFQSIGTPHNMGCWARIATGSDALTLSGSGINDYAASVLRITGHGVTNIATDIKSAVTSSSTATAVDPANLDTGSVQKWLWLAAACIDVNAGGQLTGVSSGYTPAHTILESATATATALGVGSKQAETQTENPGAFTGTARPWIAFTLAIPPAP
jgi:hypothetical protein